MIDNSPGEADLNSLQDLIFRAKHVEDNIRKLEIGQQFSWEFRDHRLKHTL